MGAKPRDQRIGIMVTPTTPVVAPYQDPAPLNGGTPHIPTVNTTVQKVAIVPAMQDIRNVPVLPGFDFRKRIYWGC